MSSNGEMSVRARGGRWSWCNITYRIIYAAHNKLHHRELSAWRRVWIASWGWIFNHWRWWVYPHLMPRTWLRSEYRFLLGMRIPPQIHGYVVKDGDCYLGQVIEDNGPWSMCCFMEDTEEECKETVLHFIREWAERAGTMGDGWSIQWHDRLPTSADKAYTR